MDRTAKNMARTEYNHQCIQSFKIFQISCSLLEGSSKVSEAGVIEATFHTFQPLYMGVMARCLHGKIKQTLWPNLWYTCDGRPLGTLAREGPVKWVQQQNERSSEALTHFRQPNAWIPVCFYKVLLFPACAAHDWVVWDLHVRGMGHERTASRRRNPHKTCTKGKTHIECTYPTCFSSNKMCHMFV